MTTNPVSFILRNACVVVVTEQCCVLRIMHYMREKMKGQKQKV